MSSEGGKVSIKVLVKDKRFREYRMDKKLQKEKSSLCQTKYEVTRRISEIIKNKTTKIKELEQAVKRLKKGRDCWTDIAIGVNSNNEDFFLDVAQASEEDITKFEKDNFFTTESWAKLKKISELSDDELQELRSVAENTESNDSEEKISHMEWIRQTTTAGAQEESVIDSSNSVSTSSVLTAKEDVPKEESVCNTASDAVKDTKCNGSEVKDKKVADLPVKLDKPLEVKKKEEIGNKPSPEQLPVVKDDTKSELPVTSKATTPLVNNVQSTIATTKDLKQNGSATIVSEKTPRNDIPKSDESRENSKNLQISNGKYSSKPTSISKTIESSQATTLPPNHNIEKPTSKTATGKVVTAETKQNPPKTNVKSSAPVVQSIQDASTLTTPNSVPTKLVSAKPVLSPTPSKPSVTTLVNGIAEQKEGQVKDTTPVKIPDKKIPTAAKKHVDEVKNAKSESLAKQSGPSQTTVKPQEVKEPEIVVPAAQVVQNIAPAKPCKPVPQLPSESNNAPLKSESVEFPKLTDPPPKVVKPKLLANPINMPKLRFSGEETKVPVPVVVPAQNCFTNVWAQRQQERERYEMMRFNVPPPPFTPVAPQPPRLSSTPLNPNAAPFKPMFQRNQEAMNFESPPAYTPNGNALSANGHGRGGGNGRKDSYRKEHSKKEPVKREPPKTVDSDGWITIAKKQAQGPNGKQPKEYKYKEPNNSSRLSKPAPTATAPPPRQTTPAVAQQVVLPKPEPTASRTVVSTSFAKVAANAAVPSSASLTPTQAKPTMTKPVAPAVKSVETAPVSTAQSSTPTKVVPAKPTSATAPKPAATSSVVTPPVTLETVEQKKEQTKETVPVKTTAPTKPTVTSSAGASSETSAKDTSPKAAPASANEASSNTPADDTLQAEIPRPAVASTVPAPTVPEPVKQSSEPSEVHNEEPVQQSSTQQPGESQRGQQAQNNGRTKHKKGKGKKEPSGMSHEQMIALAKKKKEEAQTAAFLETQRAYNEIRQEREQQHNLRRYNARNAETIENLAKCHDNLKEHSNNKLFQYRLLSSRLFTEERLKELANENSNISQDKVRYLRREDQRLGVVDHMCSFLMFMKKNFNNEVKQFSLIDLTRYLENTSFREERTLSHPGIYAKIDSEYTQFLRDTPRAVTVNSLADYMRAADNFIEANVFAGNLQKKLKESMNTKEGRNEEKTHILNVLNVFEDMHSNSLHFVNKTSYLQTQSKNKNFIIEEDLLLVMENKMSSDEISGTDHVELADNEMEWSDCDGPHYANRATNKTNSDVKENGESSEFSRRKHLESNGTDVEKSELEDGEENIVMADNSCQTEEEYSGLHEEPASSPAVKK